MTAVLDYSAARPDLAAVRRLGYEGVIRYGCRTYRPDNVTLTADEYRTIVAAGLAIGIVIEFSADWLQEGYRTGYQVALASRAEERAMGMPDGVTYLAADYDITLGGPPASPAAVGNCQRALDTMHGCADAWGGWQYVGGYGSRFFCEWLAANSPITELWSTDAWSNYIPAKGAALMQHAGWPAGVPLVDGCDYNSVLGAWAPRTATEDDMTPQQDALLKEIGLVVMATASRQETYEQAVQDRLTGFASIVIHGESKAGIPKPDHFGLDQAGQSLGRIETALNANPAAAVQEKVLSQ